MHAGGIGWNAQVARWAPAVGAAALCGVIAACGGSGTPVALRSIKVSSTAPTAAVDTTLRLTATGLYSNGSQADISGQVTWSSSNASVASVSSAGQVSTIEIGTVTISAVLNGITANVTLQITPRPPALSLLAGNPFGPGDVDGTGAAAAFYQPVGVATDSAGNVYATDSGNHTIRKITAQGVVTTLAGSPGVAGSADGQGQAAQFYSPSGLAADSVGNLYVSDSGNNEIRKITPQGQVTTIAGRAGACGSIDGSGVAAEFCGPAGITVDAAGDLYVSDSGNSTIRQISAAGVVSTLAGTAGVSGTADGPGQAAQFYLPSGLATDNAGNVYVADSGNNTIRKITAAGVVATFAGTVGIQGSADGLAAQAAFSYPTGVAADVAGNLYVTDSGNNTIRKINSAGAVTTAAGSPSGIGATDATGAAARFNQPEGIAIDAVGNLYVADSGNNTIREITVAGAVTTMAGAAALAGSADGVGAAAQFISPAGLTTDSTGDLYTIDHGYASAAIRKITPAGVVTTVKQLPTHDLVFHAHFSYGSGIAIDAAGAVYYLEYNEYCGPSLCGGSGLTLASTSGVSLSLGFCMATQDPYSQNQRVCSGIQAVYALAIDPAGNVFATDGSDSTIVKITPQGVVTTLAGMAGIAGGADGIGTAASFNYPFGIAIDDAGNLYVTDSGNTIRRITPSGAVTTLAGTAGVTGSADGTGPAAQFNQPQGIAVDGAGNAYVADTGNNTVRKITPSGVVTTIVGQAGRAGFVAGALPGRLAHPHAVAVFGTTLYVTCNNAIVQVTDLP